MNKTFSIGQNIKSLVAGVGLLILSTNTLACENKKTVNDILDSGIDGKINLLEKVENTCKTGDEVLILYKNPNNNSYILIPTIFQENMRDYKNYKYIGYEGNNSGEGKRGFILNAGDNIEPLATDFFYNVSVENSPVN